MKNMKQWIAEAISGKKRYAVPIMTHPGIEICGYDVATVVKDGEKHADAILLLNGKYPADACTSIMDLTVEAEAFGASVVFPAGEVPSVTGRLIKNREDIEKLAVPAIGVGRTSEYLKANRIAAGVVTDKPFFGGCIGPFSLAGRLYDMTEIMMAIYTEPESMQLLLSKCADFIGVYCKAIKETGADGVIIAEPAAGLISNEDCSQFSSVYIKKIVDELQDENFIVILHNCGNTGHCTDAMLETGAAGYHFGNKADMPQVLGQCPADVMVMGNLDPVSVFKESGAEDVHTATNYLLESTRDYKNFIISSGCDVPPDVPFANIEAFYRAVREYNGAE